MTTKDDGGAAFPVFEHMNGNGDVVLNSSAGMSLRDWFAGQALSSLARTHSSLDVVVTAAKAYYFADAMLAARKTEA